MAHDFTSYTSPFAWRYGSPEMRRVWSEQHKHELWRKIWVALAEAQHEMGLVSKDELADLKTNQDNLDIKRIHEIESETRHDVVAAIKEFAEQAQTGGGKVHLGATSMDVVDNTDALRAAESLELIRGRLRAVIGAFADQVTRYADLACIGYTHLQPAEPTTVGYRLAFYLHDLLIDWDHLGEVVATLRGKGIKGAVGTSASYDALLKGKPGSASDLEAAVMKQLGIAPALVTGQVNTRKYDYLAVSALASIASSLAKFAGDLQILQSANVGEWSEPFGKSQVGSSAMPFKKNPINSEKICSLARYVGQLPPILLENATVSYLERTLDDSANRRVVIADAFLATDEILKTAEKVVTGLVVNKKRVAFNLAQYGPFAAAEPILLAAVQAGGDRQELHEVLREISLEAWQQVQAGNANSMPELLTQDNHLTKLLPAKQISSLLDVSQYVGLAVTRCQEMTKEAAQRLRSRA
jgi:adenylosuccinate lyase